MRTFLAAVVGLTPAIVTAAVAPDAYAARPTCHGVVATIVGTAARDRLTGTPGRDVVVARGGNDVVRTLGGDDLICAGAGSDEVSGGSGDDRIYGGLDLVQRRPHRYHRGDFIVGGPGDDVLAPGADPRADRDDGGGDLVSWAGSPTAVTVDLGAGTADGWGHDRIVGRPPRVLLTQSGDTFRGSALAEEVHALGGDDDVRTAGGADTVYADDQEVWGDDLVRTGPGDDNVWSLGGTDHVTSGEDDDVIHLVGRVADLHADAGPGRDDVQALVKVLPGHELTGGEGRDTLTIEVVSADAEQHSFDMAAGVLLLGPDAVAASATSFEDAGLYQGHFTVSGTPVANQVLVNLASSFSGGEGDDAFGGSDGDDSFDGGPGEDSYLGDPGGTNTCTSVESDPGGVCATPARR